MKDAIIVKKVTGPFSHEMIDRRKRNEKKSGISFGPPVTDPRPCFSRRKNHDPDQKTRTGDCWFSQSTKFKSWICSDWLGSDEMEWWRTDNSWILYECLWRYKSYWRIGLESRYPNKWWQYIEYRWDVYRIRHWYRGKIIWVIGI